MKKSLFLIISLSQIFFNYSIQSMEVLNLNEITNLKLSDLVVLDNIAKFIDLEELSRFIVSKLFNDNDNSNLNVRDLIDLINKEGLNDKIYKLIEPYKQTLVKIIADFIPLNNYSKEDKIAFLDNNADLLVNILKEALSYTYTKEKNIKDRKKITNSLIASDLALKLDSQDFKNVILGVGLITSFWLFGHAACHECMEFIEPQKFISGLFSVFIIVGITYVIIDKVLEVDKKSKLNLAISITPAICNWLLKKTGLSEK